MGKEPDDQTETDQQTREWALDRAWRAAEVITGTDLPRDNTRRTDG